MGLRMCDCLKLPNGTRPDEQAIYRSSLVTTCRAFRRGNTVEVLRGQGPVGLNCVKAPSEAATVCRASCASHWLSSALWWQVSP